MPKNALNMLTLSLANEYATKKIITTAVGIFIIFLFICYLLFQKDKIEVIGRYRMGEREEIRAPREEKRRRGICYFCSFDR